MFFILQIQSNLGKLILKEEMQKGGTPRRKTRSLPDRTPIYTRKYFSTFIEIKAAINKIN